MMRLAGQVILPLLIGGHSAVQGQAEPPRAAFLAWAKESAVPVRRDVPYDEDSGLAALGEMVGDARIIALSEAEHGAAEPLLFRNAVLKYLVENMSFTAVAIESGLAEGKRVHDYVLGSEDDSAEVVHYGFCWTFDRYAPNAALVSWLRQYNAELLTIVRTI